MAISDLTNTTWTINETPNFSPLQYQTEDEGYASGEYKFAINYTVDIDGTIEYNDYLTISETVDFLGTDMYIYYTIGKVYYSTYWIDGVSRTITITGGTDATNSNLIAWLEANATQIAPEVTTVPSSFATLKYDSSTKTLVINGINYVLDSSASGNSVTSTSFSNISLTEEGVLTIDGVSINLPLHSVTPENAIIMSDGTYLVDVNNGYITTTEV